MNKIPSISSEISPLKNKEEEEVLSSRADPLDPSDIEQFRQKMAKKNSSASTLKNLPTKNKNCLSRNASEKTKEDLFTLSNKIYQKAKKGSNSYPSSLFKGRETEKPSDTHPFKLNGFNKSFTHPSKINTSTHPSHEQPSKENLLSKLSTQPFPKLNTFHEKISETDVKKEAIPISQGSQNTKIDRKEKTHSHTSNAFVGILFLQPAAPQESITLQNLSSTQASRSNDAAFLIQQIQQQVIDHVLASTDEIHDNRTVMIQLSPKLLEGTTIEFNQKGTSLNIQFISNSPDSVTFLQSNQIPLQTHLQNELQTYQSVNVQVRNHTKEDSSQDSYSNHQSNEHSNHRQTDQPMEDDDR